MRINLKLFASLAKSLPPGAKGNQVEIDVGADESPAQLLERLRVPLEQAHLWLLNGFYIEPEDRDKPLFKDGDTLAVWPPVAGG